jgi:hypothetical protein
MWRPSKLFSYWPNGNLRDYGRGLSASVVARKIELPGCMSDSRYVQATSWGWTEHHFEVTLLETQKSKLADG